MDDKLKTTLDRIKILAKQNKEFDDELRKMYVGQQASSAVGVSVSDETFNDVKAIRNALEIRANPSVTYTLSWSVVCVTSF